MTSDFNSLNNNHQSPSTGHPTAASGSLNTIQRDRFELLSAYLDGEVTAAERRQVEEWLANDPTVQRLHARLLKLRQGFQTMPLPAPAQSVEETVNQVFARVDRRPKLSLVWGGAAIAALFVGALVSMLPGGRGLMPQMAQSPNQEVQSPDSTTASTGSSSEALLIALDKPLVPIPKTPVAASDAPGKNAEAPRPQDSMH